MSWRSRLTSQKPTAEASAIAGGVIDAEFGGRQPQGTLGGLRLERPEARKPEQSLGVGLCLEDQPGEGRQAGTDEADRQLLLRHPVHRRHQTLELRLPEDLQLVQQEVPAPGAYGFSSGSTSRESGDI